MTFVLYTNSVSAHQLPLAREIAKRVGADNFRYIYTGGNLQGGAQEVVSSEPWILQEKVGGESGATAEWLENCDVLLVGGLRPIELLERRSAKGLRTFYQSERWFKPIPLRLPITHFFTFHFYFLLPGVLRLLSPSYRRMAKRFVRLMNVDPNFITLPIGPWAKKDFQRLGVRADKMRDWGYFVKPSTYNDKKNNSTLQLQLSTTTKQLCVLWVGRPLWWKRVDTIRKAVAHVPNAILDIFTNIPMSQVREEMRKHDVYVLASNAMEGWGAALSEAIEEGMICLGTYEAGASAAMLPKACLFNAGDWRTLAKKLSDIKFQLSSSANLNPGLMSISGAKTWTPSNAARKILEKSGLV